MNTKGHELMEQAERGCVCKTSRSNFNFTVVFGIASAWEVFQALRLMLCTQPRFFGCIRVHSCPWVVNA